MRFLYVFHCGPPTARQDHVFRIDCVDVPCVDYIEVGNPYSGWSCVSNIVLESRHELAEIWEMALERKLKIERVQRKKDGVRMIVAVHEDNRDVVDSVIQRSGCAHTVLGQRHQATAVLYLPLGYFHELSDAIRSRCGNAVQIMREAAKWIIMQGDHADIQSAQACVKDFMEYHFGKTTISMRTFHVPCDVREANCC